MAYIGKIKERLTITATLKNTFDYTKPAYTYGTECHTIYIFEDADSNIFKVDTTGILTYDGRTKAEKAEGGSYEKCRPINKGDVVTLKGTVKDHREYKDVPQTILQRVNITNIIKKAETPEERKARIEAENKAKRQAQLDSITGGDKLWTMPYRQYKERYADCETLVDSYDSGVSEDGHVYGHASITVIIREGRLKASGVRGEHFSGYQFRNEEGMVCCYRAVCEENALKRANKEHPNHTWTLNRIFDYR